MGSLIWGPSRTCKQVQTSVRVKRSWSQFALFHHVHCAIKYILYMCIVLLNVLGY